MFDKYWKEEVSCANCDHEVDYDGPIEGMEHCDLLYFRYSESAYWMRCKHCGGAGHCVDDTGNFWLTEDGEFV